jgi:hypothetical protein
VPSLSNHSDALLEQHQLLQKPFGFASVVAPVGFEPMKSWIQQDGKGLRWESELLEGIVSLGPRSDQHIYREIMICDKWLI